MPALESLGSESGGDRRSDPASVTVGTVVVPARGGGTSSRGGPFREHRFERVPRGHGQSVGNRVLVWGLALCLGLLAVELTILAMTRNWFAIALTLAPVAGVVAAAFARAGHRR